MDIKVRDLKQTETIENENKLMVLVDDDLNLVKNITKEEFLTNVISSIENNALVQETDGNLYVNTSEIANSVAELDEKLSGEIANSVAELDEKLSGEIDDINSNIGDLSDLTTEDKSNLVAAINEAAESGGGSSAEIGDYVWRSLPTEDVGKHLCDGALVRGGGIYDSFVNKIAEKYNSLLPYSTPVYNYNAVGTITNTDGVLSGFSNSNYATLPNTFNPLNTSLEIVFKFNLSTINVFNMLLAGSINQYIHLYVNTSNQVGLDIGNGSAWVFDAVYGTSVLSANTDYYIKLTFDSSQYIVSVSTDGETWTQEIVQTSTQVIPACQLRLGISRSGTNPLNGTIDLNESYININGERWWSGVSYDDVPCFTDEATWQQTVATYGSCGKYVYDSVNNTVRLPKVSDILQGTTDLTALGDLIEAGLPNISGRFKQENDGQVVSGAFYMGSSVSGGVGNSGSTDKWMYFDASRSNPIYGNSNTVQPQTINALLYIVIATSTKTDIQVDIDEIATDLNGKAYTDLTNITNTALTKIAHDAMPSTTYINLTLGASGSAYVMPADGWLYIYKLVTANLQYLVVANLTANFRIGVAPTGTNSAFIMMPVSKGDNVQISFTAAGATNEFRFIYTNGSAWEA